MRAFAPAIMAVFAWMDATYGVSAGSPGFPFPWRSGDDCPRDYDFCGELEFCMGEYSFEKGQTYGYRLPCHEEEQCTCHSMQSPIIRLVPGSVYLLTLRNAGTEITNLHVHGLHIVDDVTRQEIHGGNCLDYTWDLPPDHPGGTYWYHAHHHGMSEKQVGGGAFGMLIVEDNTVLNPVMPSWAANERLLQVAIMSHTDEIFGNGRKDELIDIGANQWYRLRVSLASTNAIPYNFTFQDQGMCDIHKVASDGIWRSVVPGPNSNTWELTGVSRADFAIRCSTPDVRIPIYYRDSELVAQILVGPKVDNPHVMMEFVPQRPYSISDMLEEEVPEENQGYAIKLGFNNVINEIWDPTVPLGTIQYDQVHEWTLVQTWFHPFHMHLYHMQIATPGGCGAHEEGEFYDTIAAPGNCTVRFRTADIGQRCVLQCHVLCHENNPFFGIGVYKDGIGEPLVSGGSMSWVYVAGSEMPTVNIESLQYSCPISTLQSPPPTPLYPSVPPTPSPSQSPTACVPGFLGITTEKPLLVNDFFVNAAYDVYITQQTDGNLVVKRGNPLHQGDSVWSHGYSKENSTKEYFTKLNGDSNLATLTGTPQNEGTIVWETGILNTNGSYFLGIDCHSEIVSIYAGDPNNLGRSTIVSVWNSAPTVAPIGFPTNSPVPTDSPTVSPTNFPTTIPTAIPTRVPVDTTTVAPTSAPTAAPTSAPTNAPTSAPTATPVNVPTTVPTYEPTNAPTAAPTDVPTDIPTKSSAQSPTNECVPGFLGIATGMPLLDNGYFINEEYGVYIKQQGDGNLIVRHGTPENQGDHIWSHGVLGNTTSGTFFSQLKRNSNLLTLEGNPSDGRNSDRQVIWKSASINPLGDYFLGIDCKREVVSIYAGDVFTMDDLSAAVPIWNSNDDPTRHLHYQQEEQPVDYQQ